ncbi:IS5 family transposase [Paraburkholderia sp.]|uniref:IS5 family transposase n=1 Tax=Paraburkholderia sp. TaxID=1926495 RepID=UPI003D6E2D9D
MSRQAGLFDREKRQQKLLATKDFLDRVNRFVAWEAFRPVLDTALQRKDISHGGRPPFDAVLMFRMLVLQALYNLSDEETEYQILDRQSFMHFLGLEIQDAVPDARTLWLFRETLRKAGAVEKLFNQFDGMLNAHGFKASGGQMIDATFVEVPRQRNNRDDNKRIKETGEAPGDWSEKKAAHKDVDAEWTKKNGVAFYGYKNHANVDRTHKIIRRYTVTGASVHDSQELENVLDPNNDSNDLWADSAYRSEEQEQRLKDKEYTSHIHERAYRNKPLAEEQKAANTEKSRVRVRVEHVFGHIETSMNGCFVRTIGIARARAKIGLENLAYNISRFTFLKTRGQAAPA